MCQCGCWLGWDLPVAALSIPRQPGHWGTRDTPVSVSRSPGHHTLHPTGTLCPSLTLLTILTPGGGYGLCQPSDLPCEAVTVEAGPRVPGSQLHAATAARPEIVKVIVKLIVIQPDHRLGPARGGK